MFNKRLFREGNSSHYLKNLDTGVVTVRGAGAEIYNVQGQALFVSTKL